jgi:hypothetical protein
MRFNYKYLKINCHIERSRNVINQSSTTLRLTFSNLENQTAQQVKLMLMVK